MYNSFIGFIAVLEKNVTDSVDAMSYWQHAASINVAATFRISYGPGCATCPVQAVPFFLGGGGEDRAVLGLGERGSRMGETFTAFSTSTTQTPTTSNSSQSSCTRRDGLDKQVARVWKIAKTQNNPEKLHLTSVSVE